MALGQAPLSGRDAGAEPRWSGWKLMLDGQDDQEGGAVIGGQRRRGHCCCAVMRSVETSPIRQDCRSL